MCVFYPSIKDLQKDIIIRKLTKRKSGRMPMLRLSRDFIFILRANDYSSRLDRDTSSPKSTMKTVYVLDSFYFSIYLFFLSLLKFE